MEQLTKWLRSRDDTLLSWSVNWCRLLEPLDLVLPQRHQNKFSARESWVFCLLIILFFRRKLRYCSFTASSVGSLRWNCPFCNPLWKWSLRILFMLSYLCDTFGWPLSALQRGVFSIRRYKRIKRTFRFNKSLLFIKPAHTIFKTTHAVRFEPTVKYYLIYKFGKTNFHAFMKTIAKHWCKLDVIVK